MWNYTDYNVSSGSLPQGLLNVRVALVANVLGGNLTAPRPQSFDMAEQIVVQAVGKNGKLTEHFEDNLQVVKAPVPAPKDGEVLARLIYRCASLVHSYYGTVIVARAELFGHDWCFLMSYVRI